MPQLRRATTGRPSERAKPISESVPHSPPIAITASPEETTARLRAWPMPVATTWVQYGFASLTELPGTMPIATPSASAAPRQAASITPVIPPQTSVTPASASRRPTSSASRATSESGSHFDAPITATCRALAHGPESFIERISSSAPSLCSGSLRLPHLGLCTQEGQPDSQGHSAISRSASPSRRSNCS